jgi:cobalamin synthase
MIIAGIVAAAAGVHIRIGAFTIFTIIVACGFAAVSVASGQSTPVTVMWTVACMVLMQICFVIATFGHHAWRRSKQLSERASLTDPAHNRSE